VGLNSKTFLKVSRYYIRAKNSHHGYNVEMKHMAKGLEWQNQNKEKVSRPRESTHDLKILVMGIIIDTTKNRRNGTCVNGKPFT